MPSKSKKNIKKKQLDISESDTSDDDSTDLDYSSDSNSSSSSSASSSSSSSSSSRSSNSSNKKLSKSPDKKSSEKSKKQELSTAPKKRGRPRKNLDNMQMKKPIKTIKEAINKVEDEDLMLHLRIYDNSDSEKNKFTMKNEDSDSDESEKINTIMPISDQEESSDESNINISDLINELKKRDLQIKKLKEQLSEMKNTNSEVYVSTNKDIKKIYNDLKLINIVSGKSYIVDKTDICCWYDTEKFDTIPFPLVDKYTDNKYYVFGCFCSPSCALAYNLALNDYRMNARNSLTRQLCYAIFGENVTIDIAYQRELLKKFGGTLSIDDFRSKSLLCKKEYKMQIPPLMPLVSLIEESNKEAIQKKRR